MSHYASVTATLAAMQQLMLTVLLTEHRIVVVKMFSVMAEQSPDATRDIAQDFLTTGRAGRRNALPDILGEHALVSTSDLPDRLQGLSTRDEPEPSNVNQLPQQDSKPSTSVNKNQKKS
ncbi:cAMP-dependent protein kinase inhibitor beta-like [Homalodisca vitripennis]|uniref:cAMP-dependent protein kinase inhibitor beta-like n=1 Tax=Homalodisca vitripennis TaxID=197043 RepID=UPI001EEC61FD|nr:cAMP-dependent protein kinase inhibitor beta-like [Homalodisca vitripennis]